MKALLKKILPRFLHHLYNRLISKHRISRLLGSWFDVEWKRRAGDADSGKWVEVYDNSWERWEKQDLASGDLKRISDLVNHDSTLLDAGCGDGYLLECLLDKSKCPVGVDISRIALQKARIRLGNGVDLVQAFLENLPFTDRSFEIVVSAHTIEHVRDLDKSIAELKRVAEKRLIILVPCQKYLPYTEDYHLHYFPAEEVLLDCVNIDNARCERYTVNDMDCNYRGEILLLTADLS
ncbi:class I SAM-dependent methyltransferase [bacterium]|nr:class I SAM-dependent methyltransferase [bacterium]